MKEGLSGKVRYRIGFGKKLVLQAEYKVLSSPSYFNHAGDSEYMSMWVDATVEMMQKINMSSDLRFPPDQE